MRLPHIQYPRKTPKLNQERFSGIERDVYSGEGSVCDMLDISTLDFPLLSTIPNRKKLEKKYNKPWYFGMAADNGYVIAGEDSFENNKYPLWSASASYSKDATVAYGGHLYDAVNAITGNSENKSPEVDGTNWSKSTKTNFEYDGDWKSGTKAKKGSIWYYSGNFYVSKKDNNSVAPTASSANWTLYKYSSLYFNGTKVSGFVLDASTKECAYLNGYIVIMPDKAYYHADSKTFGYLAGNKSGEFKTSDYKGFVSGDKFYAYPLEAYLMHGEKVKQGIEGTYNAIKFVWSSPNAVPGTSNENNFGMFDLRDIIKSGDVVTVGQNSSGGSTVTEIVGGAYLVTDVLIDTVVFTTSTFAGSDFGADSEHISDGTAYWYLGDITLSKGVPDMDYLCVSNNRMWGCKEDTVYGSALGDCFSWYRYTDESGAVYLETGDAGSFTGCCEYGGYPTFFKQNEMYRVYGNTRSAFSLSKSAEYGIRSDSPHSVCVVNSILFFLSESGVCAYTGGIPSVISDGLKRKLTDAVAGTDGKRYYLMTDDGDGRKMYVYDTDSRIWSCENLDNKPIGVVTYNLKLVAMDVSGEQIVLSHPENATGEEIEPDRKAYIEFNDFYGGSVDKKTIGKVIIRASVNPIYNPLEVYIQYDSDGQWQKIGQIYNQNERKKVSEFSFRPRRCDHYRLRLECKGKFTLYSLARQTE